MHCRSLQCISSRSHGSRIILRTFHENVPDSPRRSAPRRDVRQKRNADLPPPPRSAQYLGPLDGLHRPGSRKTQQASREVYRGVEAVVQARHKAISKPKSTEDYKTLQASVESKVASQTKLQFFQDSPEMDVPDMESPKTERLRPGTFVEVRRNMIVTHGVILHSQQTGNDHGIQSLSSTGEIWVHVPGDITFAVPDLVKRPMAMMAIGPEDEEEPIPPRTIAARVAILKEIRSLEKEIETNYHNISMKIHRVLEDAPWANSEDWQEVTTEEIVRAIGGKGTVARLCVHKFLMANHQRFVAYTSEFLDLQKFWVRPRKPIEDLQAVTRMLALRDPTLESFYAKAHKRIAAYRERSNTSSSPAAHVDESTVFTEEEQRILRVLRDFVRPTRSTQKDPYIVPVATVIKRMGLTSETVDLAFVHNFLIELGIVAPWDDPIVKARSLHHVPSASNLPAPSITTSSGANLRADEFYPHDIVEHVRHDFKDLHAFVIDDVNAEELDDAVSVESIPSEPGSYWVHVHVADPTLKIHPNHVLAREARLRYTTSYDIHETKPMIPSSFMYDGLSLGTSSQKGLPEHVLSFSFKVDDIGDITDYKVRAGLLRNVHVLKYDQVDKLLGLPPRPRDLPFGSRLAAGTPLDLPTLPPAQIEELRILHTIGLKFVAKRFLSGVFVFSPSSARVSMSPTPPPPNPTDLTHPVQYEGFPQLTYEVERMEEHEVGSRRMVAEAMKAAGRVASRFLRDYDIPAVRRTSTAPITTDEVMAELLAMREPDTLVPFDEILKRNVGFPRGDNEVEIKGHWAMNIPDGEGYARVTSPLRRYADLVLHWQIKHALAAGGKPAQPLFSHAWMTAFAKEMRSKELALRVFERQHQLFWAVKFIERWRADPRNLEAPNVFDDLEALSLRQANYDASRRRSLVRVLIPKLGIPAILEARGLHSHETLPKMGMTVPVKFAGLRLGAKPELLLTLRDA